EGPEVKSKKREGLGPRRAATVRALMPLFLGLGSGQAERVEVAVQRLDGFLEAVPDAGRAAEFQTLIDAVGALALARFLKLPGSLDEDELTALTTLMFDRESSAPEQVLGAFLSLRGSHAPSPWDLARSLRELMAVAYYSNPQTNAFTGFEPAWERPDILAVAPEEADAAPYTRDARTLLDIEAIRRKLETPSARPSEGWFKNDGRPRVAIVGSGPAGACVAAELAGVADVVVFEAGARFAPSEYPHDTMAAMALLYEGGLMTPTKDLDVRVLLPRAVGGGSVMNEGVSVRPRKSTLDHWQREGAGFDRAGLEAALDDAERRQRFMPIAEDLATANGRWWKRGLDAVGGDLMVAPVLSDLATHASQHEGTAHSDLRGERCLACGLCNFGCRYGHHLTVDRTFLWDAEQAGARVVENTRVHHAVSERDRKTGEVRITGLSVTHAGNREFVEADFVVFSAGTPGSPALMHRSVAEGPLRGIIPAKEKRVGAQFGFNVGSPAIARWRERPAVPGFRGVQTQYVATKAGDDSFILENGFIPPGVLAGAVPGLGAVHRAWMKDFAHLGMAVNTIGTPSNGTIDKAGNISFKVGEGTMDTMRRTLATLVDVWLHAGAEEVMPAGVSPLGPVQPRFDSAFKGRPAAILTILEAVAQLPEHVQIGSGHPQGGLAMNEDPTRGVVDGSFKVHGTSNLFVADASVFPSTIVVNLQWLVMGLGLLAGREIREKVEAWGGRELA
ncbi:MAG: GMC family oxidoreductase N-terminal domain-containing protein, partial [Deltaproteobacteria bacterium]|nr:GMC family oxidoreductase N-terminal domain-containing protein [Deltaproteobacteria bacterium]